MRARSTSARPSPRGAARAGADPPAAGRRPAPRLPAAPQHARRAGPRDAGSCSPTTRCCCARGSRGCSRRRASTWSPRSGTAEDLLRQVAMHKPDVAVVDIRMPPTHTDEGLRAAQGDPRALPGHRRARALAVRRAGLRDGAARRERRGRRLPAQGPRLGRGGVRRGRAPRRRGRLRARSRRRRAARRPPPPATTRSTS